MKYLNFAARFIPQHISGFVSIGLAQQQQIFSMLDLRLGHLRGAYKS